MTPSRGDAGPGALEVVCDGAAAAQPAVVAPPHPLYGGRLDNPVVLAVAEALVGAGYRALRFNWRGVGASAGTASGRIEDAVEDYRAALAKVASGGDRAGAEAGGRAGSGRVGAEAGGRAGGGRVIAEAGGRRVLAAGYSFGAAAACLLADDDEDGARIDRLVLVAPPVALIELRDLSRLERPVQIIVGERDQYAPVDRVADLVGGSCDGLVRVDIIPDADHFFSMPFWIERVRELVGAGV